MYPFSESRTTFGVSDFASRLETGGPLSSGRCKRRLCFKQCILAKFPRTTITEMLAYLAMQATK